MYLAYNMGYPTLGPTLANVRANVTHSMAYNIQYYTVGGGGWWRVGVGRVVWWVVGVGSGVVGGGGGGKGRDPVMTTSTFAPMRKKDPQQMLWTKTTTQIAVQHKFNYRRVPGAAR